MGRRERERKRRAEEIQKEVQKAIDSFEYRTTKIQNIYNGDQPLENRYGGDNPGQVNFSPISSVTPGQFETYYTNLSETNIESLRELSGSLEQNEALYWKILRYYAYMFTWDYTYILQEKQELSDADYNKIYKNAGLTVDGLFLQVLGPELILRLFSQGRIFLTTMRNTSSRTIATIDLPAAYCRATGVTQFGVETISFNFKYFTDLNKDLETTKQILTGFPKEFTTLYAQYLKDGIGWKELDPRYSGAISMNDAGVPVFLKSYLALREYRLYKSNELEKNSQELRKILTLKIPSYQDRLVLDVNDMVDTHTNLAPIVSRIQGMKLLTSYGDFNMLDVRKNSVAERDVIESSLKAIYQDNGLNSNMFTGNSVESQKFSRSTDESLVYHYIKMILNFLEGAANNWFSADFKKAEIRLSVLDITVYNRQEKLTQYRENATFGVNKIEFLVASGVKQSLLKERQKLEEYLDLKLVPLSSSHTLVGNQVGNEETESDVDNSKGNEDDDTKTKSNDKEVDK